MPSRFMVATIFVTSAFVDAPSYVSTGSVSLMGILTIIYAIGLALMVACRPRASWNGMRRVWPLSTLFLFSVIQLSWHRASLQAAQTLCLQWIFLALIVLMMTGDDQKTDEGQVSTLLQYGAVFAALCYITIFIFAGFGEEGTGAISFIAARSFALFALLGISHFLGQWATGSRASFWFATGLVLTIALSLSRTALIIGVLLFPLSRFRSLSARDFRRLVAPGAIALLVLSYLVFSIGPLRARFVGNNSLDDYVSGEASVDTSGRLAAWAVTVGSYIDSPWLGKGPGSANDLIDDTLYRLEIGHPLNEYLRFLHDEGAVGLGLLVAGCAQLLFLCGRAYRNSIEAGSRNAAFYLATFLSLVAVLLSMLTDNTASYVYVMGPLGILVGLTLRSAAGTESAATAASLATVEGPPAA